MTTTNTTEKLTSWQKAAYAIGELGSSVGPGTIIPFWYSIFLTDIVRLDLKLVSLFWLIVTLWDAVNDPLFGFLSDYTRSRWGRRRPYLLFGAVPFGVFFALGFIVEVLTSGLGGFGRSKGADQWGASVFLQILDHEAFSGLTALKEETTWFASSSRSSPEASRGTPVRMPGDRALELREEQLENGVLLHPSIPPALEIWSAKLDVPLP